jgi:peptidoglycan hydrolase-like protein with peptidoglycan-binding domain
MAGRSIHIGLNHVDPNAYDGWDGALSGCIYDATDMKGIADGHGYNSSIMTDAQATSHSVIAAIGQVARDSLPGDMVFISYSGHGGQVPDANGDDEDGNDETWVLWDRQLIDDELFQLWSQFQAGVRIFVVSDSCHSGTVTKVALATAVRDAARADTKTRDAIREDRPKNMPLDVQQADVGRRRTMYESAQWLSGTKSVADVRASVLLISGCQDNQLSYDGDRNGRFTQELLRAWSDGAFSGTYRQLHERILTGMPPDQSPNYYRVGAQWPEFEAQRPFTIAAPAGTSGGTTSPTQPTPTSTTRPQLRRGNSGAHVRYLQERLIVHGESIVADGYFGPGTDGAVRRFQQANGLSVDGIVGDATWAALDRAPGQVGGGQGGEVPVTPNGGNGTQPSPSNGGAPTGGTRPVLRQGASGPDVRYLQERLIAHGHSIGVDGQFGPMTASAVRSFQRSNGLAADGIVGQQTWGALERQPAWA